MLLKLETCNGVREKAIEIIKDDDGNGMAKGWAPIGTASAAIYIAAMLSGDGRTELEIAKVAGISAITVKSRSEELATSLNIDKVLPKLQPVNFR